MTKSILWPPLVYLVAPPNLLVFFDTNNETTEVHPAAPATQEAAKEGGQEGEEAPCTTTEKHCGHIEG